jgi:octaprenyl-diphosphate synthase
LEENLLSRHHLLLAAVMEMVHMATLVHDDVLDEADTRRRGSTVNRLHGNETAVILGDYLISNAYHLCSQTGDTEHALAIAHITNVVCEGELLQLHHRDDYSLDEATYVEIIDRKTASLIGLSCRIGAQASGAAKDVCAAMDRFGRQLGIAFQIRDDLLDLTGEADVVGKSLGKDIEKGKLTLPIIRHLSTCEPSERGRALDLVEEAEQTGDRGELVSLLRESGSIEYALMEAGKIVEQAKRELAVLPDSPARAVLHDVASAVVARSY